MLHTPNLQITRINLKDKRRLLFSAFAVLLLSAGLITLANFGGRYFRAKASGPVRDATLTLSAGDLSNLEVNQTFTVDIGVTSPTQDFYGVDVVLDFDETLLVVEDITNVGSEIPDGCSTGGVPGTYAILAPTTSDQPTGCDFRTSEVVSDANTNGVVDFNIMAYDWEEAIQNPSYEPTPIASGTYTVLAKVTFKAIATGTNAEAIKFIADLNCTHQFCGTTDSNVLALSSSQIPGDIVSALNPTSLSVTINEASPGPLQKITLEIRASNDDAEEENDNSMDLDSSDLDMMQTSSPHQAVGLRYNGVNIPQGATITNTYVTFIADDDDSVTTNLNISGEKIGNAPTFTSDDNDITSRSKTTAQVAWDNVPAWVKDEAYQSPDMTSIVQEIVDQGDWALGNSLVLIIEGTGNREAETFDGADTDETPLLTIEFQGGGYAYEPTDDAQVHKNNPTTNYGSSVKMDIDGTGSVPKEIAYFKFDLTNVTTIDTAVLRLYVEDKSDDDMQTVKEVDDVSWTEETLIYNNRPAATDTITTVGPTHNVGTTLDIDLTSYLSSKTGQLASLAIDQIGTNEINFSSKEAADNHPQLIFYGEASPPPEPPPDPDVSIRVSVGTDDAEESPTGSMRLTSSDLELMKDSGDGGPNQLAVGMRFTNVQIPQGTNISNAKVVFYPDKIDPTETTNLIIWGEKSADTVTFSSTQNDITSRSKTTAQVNWDNVPVWESKTVPEETPDIATLIQEIVDQGSWQAGNSIVIMIEGDGRRLAEAYEDDTEEAPLLEVYF